MPQFRWNGRTPAGQTVDGELVAPTKEEVLRRLREQGIAVTSITERAAGGEPQDPDRVYRTTADSARGPSTLTAMIFLAIAAGIWFLGPQQTASRLPLILTLTFALAGVAMLIARIARR